MVFSGTHGTLKSACYERGDTFRLIRFWMTRDRHPTSSKIALFFRAVLYAFLGASSVISYSVSVTTLLVEV